MNYHKGDVVEVWANGKWTVATVDITRYPSTTIYVHKHGTGWGTWAGEHEIRPLDVVTRLARIGVEPGHELQEG